jgi:uncharacterized damage-inducible protein DinB
MVASDPKTELRKYLQEGRDALLWKLDGLSGYDVRRPLVPTGTNLLGLVKHVAYVESGYFGETFGRPFGEPMPEENVNDDMWATPDESREDIIDLYHRVWAHSDETIETLPLDAVGRVPWWPAERAEVTLHRILIHMVSETDRHAGQADIVRELIDGTVGLRSVGNNLPDENEVWWKAYHDKLEAAALRAGSEVGSGNRQG